MQRLIFPSRSLGRTINLDNEGDYIEYNEDESELPGLQTIQSPIRCIAPHHTPKYHVGKRIGPQRRNEDDDEPCGVVVKAGWVVDADGTEDVGEDLPEGRHYDDPAVCGAVVNSLDEVDDGRDGEEDHE